MWPTKTNFNLNSNIYIEENTVFYKIPAILSWPQCINSGGNDKSFEMENFSISSNYWKIQLKLFKLYK